MQANIWHKYEFADHIHINSQTSRNLNPPVMLTHMTWGNFFLRNYVLSSDFLGATFNFSPINIYKILEGYWFLIKFHQYKSRVIK